MLTAGLKKNGKRRIAASQMKLAGPRVVKIGPERNPRSCCLGHGADEGAYDSVRDLCHYTPGLHRSQDFARQRRASDPGIANDLR